MTFQIKAFIESKEIRMIYSYTELFLENDNQPLINARITLLRNKLTNIYYNKCYFRIVVYK